MDDETQRWAEYERKSFEADKLMREREQGKATPPDALLRSEVISRVRHIIELIEQDEREYPKLGGFSERFVDGTLNGLHRARMRLMGWLDDLQD